jgi:hypothetical protein
VLSEDEALRLAALEHGPCICPDDAMCMEGDEPGDCRFCLHLDPELACPAELPVCYPLDVRPSR